MLPPKSMRASHVKLAREQELYSSCARYTCRARFTQRVQKCLCRLQRTDLSYEIRFSLKAISGPGPWIRFYAVGVNLTVTRY